MNNKRYFLISGGLFSIVALVHLLRIINQTPVIFGTWEVPMVISWAGLIITGALSFWAFILFQ